MDRFAPVRRLIEKMVVAEGVGGAGIAIDLDGDVVVEHYAGHAAPGKLASPETLWPLASISKVYTAAAIVALIERGLLSMSLRVQTVLPEFAGGGRERVTIRHLLTHTSGLIYESPEMPALLSRQTSLSAIVDEATVNPLLFAPGSGQSYSDLGYALLGRVAERVTQMCFPDVVRDIVLEPAGLSDTFMPPPSSEYHRLAYVTGSFAEGTDGAMYNSAYALNLAHPAFGTVATIRDLLHFGQLFVPGSGQGVLTRAGLRLMTTDQTGNDFPGEDVTPVTGVVHPWAAGFMIKGRAGTPHLVSRDSFGHAGASGCILWIDPDAGIVIAFASNKHYNLDRDDFLFRVDRAINVSGSVCPPLRKQQR